MSRTAPAWVRKALLPVFRRLEAQAHPLRTVLVELTQACNLACRHCGTDCTPAKASTALAPEPLLRALGEAARAAPEAPPLIVLTGGEPLVYPGVFELGSRIAELGLPWGMVTNGFAWTPADIARAKAARMCGITVSLDGLEADHDWLRGRTGSFARAVATLRLLLADRFYQHMDVVTCVSPRILPSLDRLGDLLEELGVPRWRLFIISPIGRAASQAEPSPQPPPPNDGSHAACGGLSGDRRRLPEAVGQPDLMLDAEQFRTLMEWIRAARSRRRIRVGYSESGYLGGYECQVRDEPMFCRAGISIAGIMANGDILACPNIDRRLAQGNIHQDSFLDVWTHRYQMFRDRRWMRQGPCAQCSDWRLCEGNGMHLWDLDGRAPRLCHVRAFGL